MSQTYLFGLYQMLHGFRENSNLKAFVDQHIQDITAGRPCHEFQWFWAFNIIRDELEVGSSVMRVKLVQAYTLEETKQELNNLSDSSGEYVLHKKMDFEWSEWGLVDTAEWEDDGGEGDEYDENAEMLERGDF